jgi:hypothetical protein
MVHFVHEHAQEKSRHHEHERDHAQTHQAIVGGKQINQHFHQKLSCRFDDSLCVNQLFKALMKVKDRTQSCASIGPVAFCGLAPVLT